MRETFDWHLKSRLVICWLDFCYLLTSGVGKGYLFWIFFSGSYWRMEKKLCSIWNIIICRGQFNVEWIKSFRCCYLVNCVNSHSIISNDNDLCVCVCVRVSVWKTAKFFWMNLAMTSVLFIDSSKSIPSRNKEEKKRENHYYFCCCPVHHHDDHQSLSIKKISWNQTTTTTTTLEKPKKPET